MSLETKNKIDDSKTPSTDINTAESVHHLSKLVNRRKKRNKFFNIAKNSIKIVAMTIVIIAVAFVVYKNWEFFTPSNFREVVVLNNESGSLTKIGGAVDVLTKGTAVYAAYEKGLAIATTKSIRYATVSGKDGFIVSCQFSKPSLYIAGKMVVAFDLEGELIVVLDKNGEIARTEVEGKIIEVKINRQGFVSVITETEGYKCAVSIYDKNLALQFRWRTHDYYAKSADTSVDGKTIAVAVNKIAEGHLMSSILIFDTSKDNISQELSADDYIVEIITVNKMILAICADNLRIFNFIGEKIDEYKYNNINLFGYALDQNNNVFLLLSSAEAKNESLLVSVDFENQKYYTQTLNGEVKSMSAANGKLALHCDDMIYVYGSKLDLKRLISPENIVSKVFILNDGSIVIISGGSVLIT